MLHPATLKNNIQDGECHQDAVPRLPSPGLESQEIKPFTIQTDYGLIRYSTKIGKNGSSNVQRKQMCSN